MAESAPTVGIDPSPANLALWKRLALVAGGAFLAEVAALPLMPPGSAMPGICLWAGVLLAARLLNGRAGAWPLGLASASGAIAAHLVVGGAADLVLTLGLTAVTAIATFGAARWLEATGRGARFTERPRDVLCFMISCALAVPFLLALPQAAMWVMAGKAGPEALGAVVRSAWLGLGFGYVVITPLILGLRLCSRDFLERARRHWIEVGAIAGLFIAVGGVVLHQGLGIQPAMIGVVAWAVFRTRLIGAWVLAAGYALSFAYFTSRGLGPFAQSAPDGAIALFELRVAFQLGVLLGLNSLLVENDRHLASLEQQNEELRALSEFKAQYADALEREVAARTEEARTARLEAEAANEAKSSFLARMSHEVRTPITALTGFAELLEDPSVSEEDRRRYLAIMRRNGEHLGALIDDVLDLTRIESGKLQVERAPVALRPLLDEVAWLVGEPAREKGLEFSLRVAEALPAELETDPTRLRQVILNLAGNAVKFTERGSVTIEARWVTSTPGGALEVTVSDTGIGISLAEQERLFQPFEQADTSMTRRFGGAGLGLAIAHSLVQAMGGQLSVRSAPGAGTTFTLTLPAAVSGGRPTAPPTVPTLSGRVLLAEDGPDNRLLLGAMLRSAGLELTIVEDGGAAVAAVLDAERSGRPFGLVLMDMQMPVLDGYGATKALRAEGWHGAIVAVTAHSMSDERERCLAAGCDDYLSKPVDRAGLLATVARHLGTPTAEAPEAAQA